MLLSSGTRLGSYEIVTPLGAGGMGEVYRARDTRLGREVAIKVLPDDVAAHPDRLTRFDREARAVASLNHPNIVTLHSIEEDAGVHFITMELVEGRSLDQVTSAGGLPLARVLELAIPLADALVAAHQRGIVHRDLKPANVMLTRDGRLKVLDFGLAKLASSERNLEASQAETVAAPISKVGLVVGTIPYMAPEQLRGEDVDSRTDLFSFGVMLYELTTGKRPFGGPTSADVGSAILRDTPAPALGLRSDLPRDLDRIIGRCLEKDPELRFQTAKDVRNELELVKRALDSDIATKTRVVTPSPAGQEAPSIAVLPFVNMSRDEENEYFSDGLAEELLNVLAKIRGLRVAARTSSFQFKGRSEDLGAIGRKLNVATLLQGSVRKAGNRVRISVQLVKVSDGYHLWSETYDRTLDDIFAVQDDIAQSVVKELRVALLGEQPDSDASRAVRAEVAAAAHGRGHDSEAHRLYLQARYLLERINPADHKTAMIRLREAVAADPTHALAWVGIAQGHWNAGGWGWAPIPESREGAVDGVRRALAIAPDLPEAWVMLGRIQTSYDRDWNGADESFRRAMALAPANASVLFAASAYAGYRGRLDEAIDLGRRAVEQDPLSSLSYSSLAFSYRCADRFAESEAAYRKAIELAPQRIGARLVLSLVVLAQGRIDEALAIAEAEPAEWGRLTALSIVHHQAGRAQLSQEALDQLIASHTIDSGYQIAAIHAFRGDREAMFEWLERARQESDFGLVYVAVEPVFRPYHGDPRWPKFVQKMGL